MNELLFICVFDAGSRDLGLNHLQSLKNAGIENYMAYVPDKRTYGIVKNRGFNVEMIEGDDLSTTKKEFGTKDFIEFSFLRYKVIHENLKKGKDVWYMDADTVVLENLNKFYHADYVGKGYDVIFQNDLHEINGCTGCMLMFSNQKMIDASLYMYKGMNTKVPDQHFMHNFLSNNRNHLNPALFDYMYFPNGVLYFDHLGENQLPPRINEYKMKYILTPGKRIVFVHANWMIGNDTKMAALKSKSLWYI